MNMKQSNTPPGVRGTGGGRFMKMLSRRGAQVLDFLRDLYAQQDVDAFATQVVQSLPRLIATDMTSFNEVDPGTGRSRTLVSPAGADRFPGSEEIFERHVREHPYVVNVRRFDDGQAHRVSDFIGRADFRRLAIYNEYYRRIGTEHQVAVSLPWAGSSVRGIALSRETRDYSDQERGMLAALAPHMVQACRNAETLARAHRAVENGAADNGGAAGPDGAAPTTDVEVVLLSATGGVRFATPRARRWLASYFGGSSARDGRLPSRLADWVRVQRSALEDGEAVPPPRLPLVVQRDGTRLEIRLAAECGQRALIISERRRQVPPGGLAALGLSPREAQVLAWVAEGKTNGEIGIILGARPRTVAKHLERIFRKLGVETRTAAAASALSLAAS
jgi:DNA-binding CsgD family transcriptional regulator